MALYGLFAFPQDVELRYPGGEVFSTGVCKGRSKGYCDAIVDTGTYLIYGPRASVASKLKDIQVRAGFMCAALLVGRWLCFQ